MRNIVTDDEIVSVLGRKSTKENTKKLIYGGRINAKGIIVSVILHDGEEIDL